MGFLAQSIYIKIVWAPWQECFYSSIHLFTDCAHSVAGIVLGAEELLKINKTENASALVRPGAHVYCARW